VIDDGAGAVRVVTVSATYGAGGSIVAPRLAERLGLRFFDRLLRGGETRSPAAISERLSTEERELHPPGRWAGLARVTAGLNFPVPDPDDVPVRERVRRQTESSIERIVNSGGGVILGRGAATVLAGHPRAFHVRLDGPPERRLAQGMAIEHVSEDLARSHQADTDAAWTRFVKVLFARDPSDWRLYHLVVDSTAIGLTDCVELIALAANAALGTGLSSQGERAP
jgi:cytidylate kinase